MHFNWDDEISEPVLMPGTQDPTGAHFHSIFAYIFTHK